MTSEEVLALYEATGGLQRGHFLLSSGLHSDVYLQSALVLQHPTHAETLCRRSHRVESHCATAYHRATSSECRVKS